MALHASAKPKQPEPLGAHFGYLALGRPDDGQGEEHVAKIAKDSSGNVFWCTDRLYFSLHPSHPGKPPYKWWGQQVKRIRWLAGWLQCTWDEQRNYAAGHVKQLITLGMLLSVALPATARKFSEDKFKAVLRHLESVWHEVRGAKCKTWMLAGKTIPLTNDGHINLHDLDGAFKIPFYDNYKRVQAHNEWIVNGNMISLPMLLLVVTRCKFLKHPSTDSEPTSTCILGRMFPLMSAFASEFCSSSPWIAVGDFDVRQHLDCLPCF
jgi:hypothetical protein